MSFVGLSTHKSQKYQTKSMLVKFGNRLLTLHGLRQSLGFYFGIRLKIIHLLIVMARRMAGFSMSVPTPAERYPWARIPVG